MKFLTYCFKGHESIGLLNKTESKVIDLKDIYLALGLKCPESMNMLIETWNEDILEQLEKEVERCDHKAIDLDHVDILAPIPFPKRNLFCLGKTI